MSNTSSIGQAENRTAGRLFEPLGLDHIVLQVRDLDATRKFYMDVLGCTLERENKEISLVQLRFGEHLIDLFPGNGANDPGSKTGLHHFCLSIRCDDIDALARALSAKGVMLAGPPVARTGAYGRSPTLYFTDLNGYEVELKPR